jgi:hypothetical protein
MSIYKLCKILNLTYATVWKYFQLQNANGQPLITAEVSFDKHGRRVYKIPPSEVQRLQRLRGKAKYLLPRLKESALSE